jgi:hypothetical protein
MSSQYTYQKFMEECKSLTQAILDSDLQASNLTKCELITVGDDNPLLDFLPIEAQTHLHL